MNLHNLIPWSILLLASLFEILWAILLHYSNGFQNLLPSIAAVSCAIISFTLLTLSVKYLPISVSYAIWTGVGIIGTTIFNHAVEKATPFPVSNYLFISIILISIIGLCITNK